MFDSLKQSILLSQNIEDQKFLSEILIKHGNSSRFVYRGSKDGFQKSVYQDKSHLKGPLLILMRTTKNVIIGAYSSLTFSKTAISHQIDNNAFIFNLKTQKIYRANNDT